MQLTKHTDFAFRTLIYLAMMEQELTTIQHITDSFDISKSHAMKIVNTLANKGWVKSIRGKKRWHPAWLRAIRNKTRSSGDFNGKHARSC
jgi:DNA-binding IclR family transcriptional regulator